MLKSNLKAPPLVEEDLKYFRVLEPHEKRHCWGLCTESGYDLSTMYGGKITHRTESMCANMSCSNCIFNSTYSREDVIKFINSIKCGNEEDLLL